MSKLKFSNVVDGIATMLIYKHIGNDTQLGFGIDGNSFANEIMYVNEYYSDSVNKINVRINSTGGDVQEGLSIVSAILNSKIPCDTYIDGMAYSMAGVIAMCGKKKHMADYATFMMHNVSGSTNDEVLDLLTNSLAKIFEMNSTLTMDKCKELMARETWMDATDCMNNGLIDEIVVTNNNKTISNNLILYKSKIELHSFYNSILIEQPKKIKMIKLTNLLKLNNEASEDVIVAEVESLQNTVTESTNTIETLTTENTELKAKLKSFEDAEIALEVAEVELTINNAITEGKITAESKDKWLNRKLNSVSLKEIFAEIKTTPVHVSVSNVINEKKEIEGKENWTFSDWEKKDSKGLAEMAANNKPAFDLLISKIPQTITSKK